MRLLKELTILLVFGCNAMSVTHSSVTEQPGPVLSLTRDEMALIKVMKQAIKKRQATRRGTLRGTRRCKSWFRKNSWF